MLILWFFQRGNDKTKVGRKMKKHNIIAALISAAVLSFAGLASADDTSLSVWPDYSPYEAVVYVSPTPLPAGTVVSDGGFDDFPACPDETVLIWVDPHPEMRYAHETFYVFISADGTISIESGMWWPEIGGDNYMWGDKPWLMDFAVDLYETSPFAKALYPSVKVYANPFLLNPTDDLTDGNGFFATDIDVIDDSLFFWIDLNPAAKFAHGTAYLMIPADGMPYVEHGSWFPYLFGEQILYGQADTTLRFPYPIN